MNMLTQAIHVAREGKESGQISTSCMSRTDWRPEEPFVLRWGKNGETAFCPITLCYVTEECEIGARVSTLETNSAAV